MSKICLKLFLAQNIKCRVWLRVRHEGLFLRSTDYCAVTVGEIKDLNYFCSQPACFAFPGFILEAKALTVVATISKSHMQWCVQVLGV